MTKICTNCGTEQPLLNFYKDPKGRLGVSNCCASCHKARVSAWAKNNKPRHNANGKKWKKLNADKVRDSALRYNFGLSEI